MHYLPHPLSIRANSNTCFTLKKRKPSHGYGRKTIVLDMDETLIHCNQNWTESCDVVLSMKDPTGVSQKIGINLRPFLHEFLFELRRDFEIIVETAN